MYFLYQRRCLKLFVESYLRKDHVLFLYQRRCLKLSIVAPNIACQALAIVFVVKRLKKVRLALNLSSTLIDSVIHFCSKQGTPKTYISKDHKMGNFAIGL